MKWPVGTLPRQYRGGHWAGLIIFWSVLPVPENFHPMQEEDDNRQLLLLHPRYDGVLPFFPHPEWVLWYRYHIFSFLADPCPGVRFDQKIYRSVEVYSQDLFYLPRLIQHYPADSI